LAIKESETKSATKESETKSALKEEEKRKRRKKKKKKRKSEKKAKQPANKEEDTCQRQQLHYLNPETPAHKIPRTVTLPRIATKLNKKSKQNDKKHQIPSFESPGKLKKPALAKSTFISKLSNF
jgi:hypothetical protein